MNLNEYFSFLSDSSYEATNLIKDVISGINSISDSSSILDASFDSLEKIFKQLFLQILGLKDPNIIESNPLFGISTSHAECLQINKNDKLISEEFGNLFSEIKYLFNTERPRSWHLASILIKEIISWAFELIYNYPLLEDNPNIDSFSAKCNNSDNDQRFSFNISANKPGPINFFSTNNNDVLPVSDINNNLNQVSDTFNLNSTKSKIFRSYSIQNKARQDSRKRSSYFGSSNGLKPFLSEESCRRIIRYVWYQLVSTAQKEHLHIRTKSLGKSIEFTPWRSNFESFVSLIDIFMGIYEGRSYPSFVSHFNLIQDLDPGAVIAESGSLPSEMQFIVDMCVARKRKLARVAFPPDTMWPMVSHASRKHTEKHIYDQIGYACLRDTLSRTELERGPSAEKYIADLLYQRAAIDDVYACIRNHRMMKKKTIKELQRHIYVPPDVKSELSDNQNNQLNACNLNSSFSNVYELEMIEDSKLLLDVLVHKIEYTIRHIQKCSNFKNINLSADLSTDHIAVPQNLRFWERVNELADQIFFFVQTNAISYTDLHNRLYGLVVSESSEESVVPKLEKDNTLIWLLLQLFHVEKVAVETISADFSNHENFLADFLEMYNESQIQSLDSFYLRDLSLQSVLSHQQQNIRDRVGIKFRHPKINSIMKYTQTFYKLQTNFGNDFKRNIIEGSYTLFKDQPIQEIIKIASISQARQYIVPNAIYGYLVPFNYTDLPLQNPDTRYLHGGLVNYKILDYINVGSKNRLLQIIYKMMLAHEQGPQFQFQVNPTKNDLNCVSPYVLDVVYKLLYNAPYTNELMMKEILEKLRRCDKVMAMGNAHFSNVTTRWLYTVYQLMNCRLLRFFKYYAHAAHLIHHLRHSLIFTKHPQLYTTLENFALCLVKLQHEPGFLVALMNPDYHGVPITSYPHIYKFTEEEPKRPYVKPVHFWFNCALLYRNAIMAVSRIILIRGLGDIPGLSVDECLVGLSNRPSNWAPQVLQFMAPQVLDHYLREKRHIHSCPKFEAVNEVLADERIGPVLRDEVSDQSEIEQVVEIMINRFTISVQRQTLFLCLLWQMEYDRVVENKKTSSKFVSVVRKVLLRFQKSFKTEHSSVLMDYAVSQIKASCSVDEITGKFILSGTQFETQMKLTFSVLERFIWLFMFIRNEHVLYGLVRGEFDIRDDPIRMRIIHYILFESPGFSSRLEDWKKLDFPGRYWEADDYYLKQVRYLNKNPEYFEYEYYLLLNNEPVDPPTQLALPMYYENEMVRLLPVLEYALDRLIEAEQTDLLIKILDHFGMLFRLDQVPLNTLYNILFVYFGSPTLHNSKLIRSLSLSLLDLSQQQLSPEFENFLLSPKNSDLCTPLGPSDGFLGYFESLEAFKLYILGLMDRIGVVLSRSPCGLDLKPGLPEIHYREIPNPVLLVLTECIVETLAWWCISQESKDRIPSPLTGIDTSKAFDSIKNDLAISISRWKHDLTSRASYCMLVQIWLYMVLEVSKLPTVDRRSHNIFKNAKCIPTTYFHVTGIFANSLPIDLMTTPYIKYLANIVFTCKELKVSSTTRAILSLKTMLEDVDNISQDHYMSNWDFDPASDSSKSFKTSDIFENYVHNLREGTQNLPNAYSTLLHSILHYGGQRAFSMLSETIKSLANGTAEILDYPDLTKLYTTNNEPFIPNSDSDIFSPRTRCSSINTDAPDFLTHNKIHSDIQLLYICSTIAPVLYRLESIPNIFSEIIESLFTLVLQISNTLPPLKQQENSSTIAFEIVVDFFYFSKSKFSMSKFEWKSLEYIFIQLPINVKNRFRNLVYG
ncbi:Mediator of RNA polymerase II transcription subunit 23 [Smittium culicis]|uniref:Mediator of RNA polymerase II transcription subunit 23 n=4 Tax=Smittium culicis TaxID=133412 RepID=A0A1R1X1S4_9FUNG|nr:Mediator of RNA polymerase II transcription subunit 23 [Smittium culicis]